MASFRKVKSGWRAEVYVNGKRASRVLDTKAQARTWANEKERELKTLNDKNTTPCNELFDYYIKNFSSKKRGKNWETHRIESFRSQFHMSVGEVTRETISQWRDKRLLSVSGATVKREMTLLAHCFEIARKDLDWIKENPCRDVTKPRNSPPRDRLISDNEIELIRIHLNWPRDQIAIQKQQKVAVGFCFAIETAMRMGEICNLKPNDINGSVANLTMTKNGTSRQVPLSNRARELLTFVPGLWDMTAQQFDALFRRGRDRSGIKDLVFHDTRHEAITRLAKKLNVLDLARMVGHKDVKMLMVYYNETAESLADKLD